MRPEVTDAGKPIRGADENEFSRSFLALQELLQAGFGQYSGNRHGKLPAVIASFPSRQKAPSNRGARIRQD